MSQVTDTNYVNQIPLAADYALFVRDTDSVLKTATMQQLADLFAALRATPVGAGEFTSLLATSLAVNGPIVGTAATTGAHDLNATGGGRLQLFGGTHALYPGEAFLYGDSIYLRSVAGVQRAKFSSTGLEVTGGISVATNSDIRATKSSLNFTVNVKDYGAIGDNSADDTAAITAAIAALPASNGHLYFPAGTYKLSSTLSAFSSKAHLTISGDGAALNNIHHGNTFEIQNTCSFVDIKGLKFIGNATTRSNGIHIRTHADDVTITTCYFQGCSDHGVFIGHDSSTTACKRVVLSDCTFNATYGDGAHVMNASDVIIHSNIFLNTGDDSIGIVADVTATPPSNVTVSNNLISGSSFRGITILEGIDVLVSGNQIEATVGAAIEVGRFNSTTLYNKRVTIQGNKIYNSTTSVGPRGAIALYFAEDCHVLGNTIRSTANGSAIAFLDTQYCSIVGNQIRTAPSRAIASDDTTTTNVATAWVNLTIKDNKISDVTASQAIYVNPATGITLTDFFVEGNVGMDLPAGDWIHYDRVATGRVYNNTNLQSRTVNAGGTVTGVTAGNNN